MSLAILRRVEAGAWADRLLDRLPDRAGLSARDRALTTELVYGTLRWQRRLDAHLAQVSRHAPERLAPWLRVLLRLSAYQLGHLDRVPPWAVVHEAVELAKPEHPPGAADLVNAVLRKLAAWPRPWPDPPASGADPCDDLGIRLSMPTWLLRRWVGRFGEAEALALARALNERPPLVLRVNPLRATVEQVVEALGRQGATARPGALAPEGLVVEGAGDPRALAVLRDGWAAAPDEASILVGHAVGPQPGQTVADVCAAPGTKTTHLAALMQDRGRIIAGDPHPGKVGLLRAACRRLGATIVETRTGGAETLRDLGPICDRVLVDAPCSNLGVLRRNPEARWRRGEADLATHAAAQRAILEVAATLVRPGGVLVYATCSLEPEENEMVVAGLLDAHPELGPDPIPAPVPAAGRPAPHVLRTLPHRDGTDGFTAFRFRRRP